MKKLVVVLALLVALPATALAGGYKNEPDGFRGVKWGTELSSRKDMQRLAQDKNGNVYYKRRNDKMHFADASLKMVWYREHHHQFESVYIESRGTDNQSSLLAALNRQFGPGARASRSAEKYLWDGPTTRIFVSCDASHTCTVVLMSKKLLLEENQQQGKATGE